MTEIPAAMMKVGMVIAVKMKPRLPMNTRSAVRRHCRCRKGLCVMTNYHVIKDAKEITVTLKDRREFTAKVIGGDEPTDVALLKIDAKGSPRRCRSATPGQLKVGDYVVAVGNPFGLGQTVTSGIVSCARAFGSEHRRLRGFHSDRCLHQPRQFRRCIGEPQGRTDRH